MNNKEFIAELSDRTGYSLQRTAQLVAALIDEIGTQLEEENTISENPKPENITLKI